MGSMRLAKIVRDWANIILILVAFWVLFGPHSFGQPWQTVAAFDGMERRIPVVIPTIAQGAVSPSLPVNAPATSGQQTITLVLKQVSTVTTRMILGQGKAAALWSVGVCNDTAVNQVIPRIRLMAAVPNVPDIPNALAEDAIGRQAAAAPASILGANGDTLISFASSGLMIGGIATSTSSSTWAGVGLSAASFALKLFAKSAPNPSVYFSQLLPDNVALAPLACSPYYLFTSVTRGGPTSIVVRLAQ
jgi:hypothetical protein